MHGSREQSHASVLLSRAFEIGHRLPSGGSHRHYCDLLETGEMRVNPRISFLSAGLVVGSISAGAQTVTGSIMGRVTDPSRAGIPKAAVVAVALETGGSRTTITGLEGFYQLGFLPLGTYRLTAKARGFTPV